MAPIRETIRKNKRRITHLEKRGANEIKEKQRQIKQRRVTRLEKRGAIPVNEIEEKQRQIKQEKGGVKMVLIQDGLQQTAHKKPLRRSKDPRKVEFAKRMVLDYLALTGMERGGGGGGGGGYSNGGGPLSQEEMDATVSEVREVLDIMDSLDYRNRLTDKMAHLQTRLCREMFHDGLQKIRESDIGFRELKLRGTSKILKDAKATVQSQQNDGPRSRSTYVTLRRSARLRFKRCYAKWGMTRPPVREEKLIFREKF